MAKDEYLVTKLGPATRIAADLIAAVFLEFYEVCRDELIARHTASDEKWPAAWRFGKMTRDAIAHGGKMLIIKEGKSVTWRGLEYSSRDSGRQLINAEISLGVIIMLMVDMSKELD